MAIRTVVRRHGVGWSTVMALAKAWSHLIIEHRRAQQCRVLLVGRDVDMQTAPLRDSGPNGDTGKVLAMIEYRNSAALRVC